MAELKLGNVDESLVAELKRRAKSNGRSVEEEHRRILRDALFGSAADKDLDLKAYLLLDSADLPDLELPDRTQPFRESVPD